MSNKKHMLLDDMMDDCVEQKYAIVFLPESHEWFNKCGCDPEYNRLGIHGKWMFPVEEDWYDFCADHLATYPDRVLIVAEHHAVFLRKGHILAVYDSFDEAKRAYKADPDGWLKKGMDRHYGPTTPA
ncbi:MAG: hypothetical protein D6746_09045 [Bacteroidetes bacterium]|nr:MAG: hypothetical protein D6746_09045 [Bacteroidota bacterium]